LRISPMFLQSKKDAAIRSGGFTLLEAVNAMMIASLGLISAFGLTT